MQSMNTNTDKQISLKPLSFSDAEALAELANDISITKNMEEGAFPYPYTIEDAYLFIEWAEYTKMAHEGFSFAIELKDIGIIGVASIYGIDKGMKTGSIGYLIAKKHRGKGYGKEAVRQLLSFAFCTENFDALNALCKRSNVHSKLILAALGFSKKSQGDIEEFFIKRSDYVSKCTTQ